MITVITLILTIIGAINWGVIGIADFNIVAWICAQNIVAQRVIYSIVGICSLWLIAYLIATKCKIGIPYTCPKDGKKKHL